MNADLPAPDENKVDVSGVRPHSASAADERAFSDAMIESLPGVLYFYDEQGTFLRWNQNLETVTGYSHEEIARLHPLDLFAGADKQRVQVEIAKVFDQGDAFVEAGLVGKSGDSTPYYFTGRRVVVQGVPCLVGLGLDMSDRQRVESRLRSSEASLARAQRIAHMGSWEMDIASGQVAWSDEMYRIFGMLPGTAEASFETFLAHVHPDDRERVRQAHEHAVQGGMPLSIEHRILRADGAERWVQKLAEPQLDASGNAEKLAGTILDFTERKQIKLQLQEAKETLEQTVVERTAQLQAALVRAEAADKVKSAFLATMSHELRTPLNSIIGFTGILLQSLPGPINPVQGKQLGMVQASAQHLLELINDVLDISKIEAQQLQLYPERFDLAPLVERIVASVGPQAAKKDLALSSVLPPGPIEICGDRRRIQQVLINLLSNAIKFTEHGSVTLAIESLDLPATSADQAAGSRLCIRVTDTGVGIHADDLPKLFLPFQQLDTGLTRTYEGTGLGLTICKRLVELMGGSISVDSAMGVGSTFTVDLPKQGVTGP